MVKQSKNRCRGFTLIEMLIVIGLIASVTAWVVFNQTAIGFNFTRLSPQEVLHSAVEEARYQANTTHSEISLLWDMESQTFQLLNAAGILEVPEFQLQQERLYLAEPISINFRPLLPAEKLDRFKLEESVEYGASEPLRLRFSPFGISSSGKIDFVMETNESYSMLLDPLW
mgnify:CR=1 FL=1